MKGAKQKEMLKILGLRRREILHLRSVCLFVPRLGRGGGGGGSDIFHTYLGLCYFFGFDFFEFQYFGGFQKTEYFWGMKILWIFFWGHHKIGLYLEVISMHFRGFSEGRGTEWRTFFGLQKFIYLFAMLEIPDIFGVNGKCCPSQMHEEKIEIPPTPLWVCPSVQTYPC